MPNVALIILAAGESRRFGRPKQLALFHGQTLIERAVNAGFDSICRPVTVVLGANAEMISTQLADLVNIVVNPEWKTGMASSIRRGVESMDQGVEGVVVMLCDQPMITAEILNRLAQCSSKQIAAAEYADTVGVPAFFGRQFFAELMALSGNDGAKQVLAGNISKVTRVGCPEAAFDIDTPEDMLAANERENAKPKHGSGIPSLLKWRGRNR